MLLTLISCPDLQQMMFSIKNEPPPPGHTLDFLSASLFYPQALHDLQVNLYSIPRQSASVLFISHPLQLPSGLGSKNFHHTLAPVSSISPSALAQAPRLQVAPTNNNEMITSNPLNFPSTGGPQLTPTSSQALIVKIPGILQDSGRHVSSLQSATVGVFTLHGHQQMLLGQVRSLFLGS